MAERSLFFQRMSAGVVRPHARCNALGLFLVCMKRLGMGTERRRVVTLTPHLHFRAPKRNRAFIGDALRVDIQVPSGNQAGEGHG